MPVPPSPEGRHRMAMALPIRPRWMPRAVTAALSPVVTVIVVAGTLLAALLVVPAAALARFASSPLPGIAVPTSLPDPADTPLATVVTDRTGEPIARLYDQFRVPTDPGDIADTMKAAVVAIEDRRFFTHGGVDWRGVGRAVISNLATSGAVFDGQGASTITMQYVKNHRLYALADDPAEREAAVADTLDRKLADVTVALALEDRLGKQEILARYLDTVYFGNGAYGVAAAARTYFATTPAELTLPQAALLAAVVKAPSTFDPVDEPAAAVARRDLVLAAMVDVGSITPEHPRPVCAGDPPSLCSSGTLFGGTVPADTWFATMSPLHEGLPVEPLPEPDPDLLHGRISDPG